MDNDLQYRVQFYPSIYDPLIREKLCNKREFYDIYENIRDNSDEVSSGLYRNFLLRYISPPTPYDRLLIIHAVGTGKTECAIRIVEQYKSIYRQAVILNKSDKPTANFQNLLEKYFVNQQYNDAQIHNEKKFYVFTTYNKFVRHIMKHSMHSLKQQYESTIFILDEIHNIITQQHEEEYSPYKILLSLFDALEVTTIVGLTATPMRDRYSEIVPLVNMFIKDKEKRISEDADFEDIKKTLEQVSRSTISAYSENFNFKQIDMGWRIKDTLAFSCVVLKAGEEQVIAYNLELACNSARKDTGVDKRTQNNFMQRDKTYALLATIPEYGIAIDDRLITEHTYTEDGKKIISAFKYTGLTENSLRDLRAFPSKYSAKFAYIMEIIEQNKNFYSKPTDLTNWNPNDNINIIDGLVYIFCEDIKSSGIKNLMAMFNLFGYEYYTDGHIKNMRPNKRRYTVYVGMSSICPNSHERLQTFRHPSNINGDYCKIIIASRVMSEAISLKAIRNVFIMTPHWNYSLIIQAEGRAIRKDAFYDVDTGKRDVKIHRLITVTNKNKFYQNINNYINGRLETKAFKKNISDISIDYYKYFVSSEKYKLIKDIEEVYSKNALDYYVIGDVTQFPQVENKSDLDVSTYVTFTNNIEDHILTRLTDMLHSQLKVHIDEFINEIKSRIDITDEIVIQHLDNIIRAKKGIYNNYNVPFFIQIEDDMLYLTNIPDAEGFAPIDASESLTYKYTTIDQYIKPPTGKINNFSWCMSKLDIVNIIDHVREYRVMFIESAVRMYYNEPSKGVSRFIQSMSLNLHNINGDFYHILETTHIPNTSYGLNVHSINSNVIIKRYCKDRDIWLRIDNDERPRIRTIIQFSNMFYVLKYTILYGTYGYISLRDGKLRIHDYELYDRDISDVKRGIALCDEHIDVLCNYDPDIPLEPDEILKRYKSIAEHFIVKNETLCNDMRSDKRGHDIKSYVSDTLIDIIMNIYMKTLTDDQKQWLFYTVNKHINTNLTSNKKYANMSKAKSSASLERLCAKYPQYKDDLDNLYTNLKSINSPSFLQSKLKEIILGNGMYYLQ